MFGTLDMMFSRLQETFWVSAEAKRLDEEGYRKKEGVASPTAFMVIGQM
jgi:hypothetical protein